MYCGCGVKGKYQTKTKLKILKTVRRKVTFISDLASSLNFLFM